MPTPVRIVITGGIPVTDTDGTPGATPMTPVDSPLQGIPVVVVEHNGIPVTFVNADYSDYVTAPEVASQTMDFGALTLEDAGGAAPTNTGGSITSASIDSGDASGHWQIASDGTLTPTASGEAAGLNAGPYELGLTLTNDEGSVTPTITITPTAGAYSVRDDTELLAAATAIGTASSGARDILCREGGATYEYFIISSKLYTNTVTIKPHPNQATPPTFLKVKFQNSSNITLQGCNIYNAEQKDWGAAIKLEGGTDYTVIGNHIRGSVYDINTDWTAGYDGSITGVSSTSTPQTSNISVLDNLIEHVAEVCYFSSPGGDIEFSGNHARHYYVDGCRFSRTGTDGVGTITKVHDNVLELNYGLSTNADNPHPDFFQFVGGALTDDWEGIDIQRNRCVYSGQGLGQAILMQTSPSGIFYSGPVVKGNLLLVEDTAHAIRIYRAKNAVVIGNTVCRVDPSTTSLTHEIGIRVGTDETSGQHTIHNNICEQLDIASGTQAGDHVEPSLENNVVMGRAGVTIGYGTVFDGPTFAKNISMSQVLTNFSMKANGPADIDDSGDASIGDAGAIGSGYVTHATEYPGRVGASVDADYEPSDAEVVDLNLASGSVRFPEDNHQTDAAGSYGAIYQPTSGIPTGWLVGDGAIFAVIRLPLDRMDQDARYRFLGGDTSTSFRRFYMALHGTGYSTASLQGKLRGYIAGGSGGKVNCDSAVVDEEDILAVFRRDGDDHYLDWYSLADGTKHAGTVVTDATALGIDLWGRAYFGIGVGHDPDTLPTGGSLERTGLIANFPGEIAEVGYIDAAVSDANWQSIALGADVVTTLGATNLEWYRKFEGKDATSLAARTAATADSSSTAVLVDGDNLTSGANFKRQDTTNYLLIDYIETDHDFALVGEATSRDVTFSGTAGGYTGNVEVRIVGEDGTVHKDWTVCGSISSGAWSGTISVDQTTQRCWLQARPASTPAVVAEMRELFGVGYP